MKRSTLIQDLVRIYDTRPENCSSYHIIDMLIYAAERRGMDLVTVDEDGSGSTWVYRCKFGFDEEDEE